MKICLVTFIYDPKFGGGAAVVAQTLTRELSQAGHRVTVITTAPTRKIEVVWDGKVKVIQIPSANLYWVGNKDCQPIWKKVIWQLIDIWNPMIYRLVRQIVITEQVDIFHSHKLRGLSPSIWSAAASAGVKRIVHTCHDFELLSPEGLFMGKVGRLAQEQNIVMRPYQILRRHFSRLVDQVTSPSRLVLNTHKKMGFFPKATTKIIPNTHGYDSGELRQNFLEVSKSPKKELPRRFLYLGRLDKAKGIDLLCQAFLRIASQNPDILLRIAGWGPLDASLREKYKDQHNIIFTGPVFGAQKAELFKDSDVLVAPSLAPENFPIVIAEAYAHGLPVITSRAGAFPEIVREGETGFLVETGSVDHLCSALARVSQDPRLTSAMSARCIEEAQKYTTEKFIGDYLELYRGSLDRRKF
jgi:glycosyltransferase involved in cell wall biosynthesis